MKYKIIASDLDGTLLNSQGNLNPENLSAIRALSNLGVYFVPASGRSLSEMPEILRDEKSIRYFIHSSGAGVYDKVTGENVSFGFPHELSNSLFRLIFSVDCHVTVRMGGRMLTDIEKMDKDSMCSYNVWPAHDHLLHTSGEGIVGFKEEMLSASDIDMISLFFRSEEELITMRHSLSKIEGINVASACDYNIEITYEKAGKGNALLALADRLSVEISDVIAIGDSENDLPMILSAGLGLATENAAEKVKARADFVICSNDENAIPFIIKKYF